MTGETIIVCGGRDYRDEAAVWEHLDRLAPRCVVTGGANGGDTCAEMWARANGAGLEVYSADWKRDGRAAGPIRNRKMLEASKPDRVVAFPGGRGTAAMVRPARKAGVPVEEVAP